MAEQDGGQSGAIVISAAFKMAFWAVLGLTLLSLGMCVAFSFIDSPTPQQQSIVQGCSHMWKTGAGALFGLLGGKVT